MVVKKERISKRVQRIAALLKACTPEELAQLVNLVPQLQEAQRFAKVEEEAIKHFRQVLTHKRDGAPLALDEPFLGGLTYREYLALSPEDEDALWERLFAEAEESLKDLEELEEADVRPDARLPTRRGGNPKWEPASNRARDCSEFGGRFRGRRRVPPS